MTTPTPTPTPDRITVIIANAHVFAVRSREVADKLTAQLRADKWDLTWGRVTPDTWDLWRPEYIAEVGVHHVHESL